MKQSLALSMLIFLAGPVFGTQAESKVEVIHLPGTDKNCKDLLDISRLNRAIEKMPRNLRQLRTSPEQIKISELKSDFSENAFLIAEDEMFAAYNLDPQVVLSNFLDSANMTPEISIIGGSRYIKKVLVQNKTICTIQRIHNGWGTINSILYPHIFVKATCEKAPLKLETKVFQFQCETRALDDIHRPEINKELLAEEEQEARKTNTGKRE